MSSLEYWVLDVGQGSGNFLQTFKDDGSLAGSALLDFGSSRGKRTAGFKSVDKVVELLGDPATLDLLVLSHSDVDHIALVPEVLRRFSPNGTRKPKLTINELAYGGTYEQYSKHGLGGNVVAQALAFMPAGKKAVAPSPRYSVFQGAKPEPNFTVGDTDYYLLMANAASEEPPRKRQRTAALAADGYNVNTNSIVVLVEHGDVQFVVTGDATGTTLYQVNRVLDGTDDKHFDDVRMLTLPHHGSATTTFDVKGLSDGKKNLEEFAAHISPRSVTGSADKVATYKHPSAKVMSYFWEYVKQGGYWQDPLLRRRRHFYTAYFLPGDDFTSGKEAWPKAADWYSVESAYGVYTNMYVDRLARDRQAVVLPPVGSRPHPFDPDDPLPLGVAWKYTVDPDVDPVLTLEREVNRADYERLIARAGWVPEEWPDPATLGDARFVTLPSARGDRRDEPAPPGPPRTAPPAVVPPRPLPRVRALP